MLVSWGLGGIEGLEVSLLMFRYVGNIVPRLYLMITVGT